MRALLSALGFLIILTPVIGTDLAGKIVVDSSGLSVISVEGFEDETHHYTSKTGSEWYFSFMPPNYYDSISLKVYLPKNAVLKSIDSNLDYSIGYENSLFLFFEGLSKTPRIIVNYSFEPVEEFDYYLILVPLSLLVIAVLLILFLKKKSKLEKKFLSALNKRERQVMLTLKDLGGNVKQSKLRRVTGLPKSTLSRTVKSLERKGLVSKQGHGMTNRVIIK